MDPEEVQKWQKGSIEGQLSTSIRTLSYRASQGCPVVFDGRGIKEYLEKLNITRKDIRGKHVLDLGSGPTARFAQEVGRNAFVVSMSPDYSVDIYRSWISGQQSANVHAIAAIGEELPFRTARGKKGFDLVLMLHVTEWVEWAMYYANFLSIVDEGVRVLKKGGRMIIFPVYEEQREYIDRTVSNKCRKLVFEVTRWYVKEDIDSSGYGPTYSVPLYRAVITK